MELRKMLNVLDEHEQLTQKKHQNRNDKLILRSKIYSFFIKDSSI